MLVLDLLADLLETLLFLSILLPFLLVLVESNSSSIQSILCSLSSLDFTGVRFGMPTHDARLSCLKNMPQFFWCWVTSPFGTIKQLLCDIQIEHCSVWLSSSNLSLIVHDYWCISKVTRSLSLWFVLFQILFTQVFLFKHSDHTQMKTGNLWKLQKSFK